MNYWRYETLKSTWVHLHPNATPDEYQRAMLAIARKCGV